MNYSPPTLNERLTGHPFPIPIPKRPPPRTCKYCPTPGHNEAECKAFIEFLIRRSWYQQNANYQQPRHPS